MTVNRNTVFGYATSMGVGAYEIVGEANGVFVKYAKNHLFSGKSIVDALGAVLRGMFVADSKHSDPQTWSATRRPRPCSSRSCART